MAKDESLQSRKEIFGGGWYLVNQEDSIIMNKSAIERGLFCSTSYKTLTEEERKRGTYNVETITLPPMEIRKTNYNYNYLDENGIVKKGSKVEKGDVIVGKILMKSNKNGDEETVDCSLSIRQGEDGMVDRIIETITPNGYKLVKVVIRKMRFPEIGDKFASRSAQKGTCGMVLRQEDLPFTVKEGIVPDIIINSHCLSGDTVIRLGNGEVKYIQDIFDKNFKITTVNPDNLELSITQYTNGFVKTCSSLKELKTISGRKIKCTPDHKLLVWNGKNIEWKRVDTIMPWFDKVIVHHSIEPVSETDGEELYVKENIPSIYLNRLKSLGLQGVITNSKACILARLLGIVESDGHISFRKYKDKQLQCVRGRISVGEEEDAKEIIRDVEYLGFNTPTYRHPKPDSNLIDVELEPALVYLLLCLGACSGNKTKSVRKFPEWLKIVPSNVKREFLSGYHGGDGSKIAVNWKFQQQQPKIAGLPCRSNIDVLDSHYQYVKELSNLYAHFGIETSIQVYSTKFEDRKDIRLYFSTKFTNIERCAQIIAYRYCNHKRRESRVPIEYLKCRMRGFHMEYNKFKNCFQKYDLVTTFVEEIKDVKPELVFDFTTISSNHSFIANSIVSHNCLPSRMTINQLMECVLGKTVATDRKATKFGDATPFASNSTNIADKLCDELQKNGYNGKGWEKMINGMTGEMMQARIFMGPTYYQRLKHLVSEKVHSRQSGHVTTLHRQPLSGRSRDGGLRFGEMEKDCMITHGTSRFLKERLFDQSDPYQVVLCKNCGNFATTPTECKACDGDRVSRVNIPYSAKLLLQELNAMGIKTLVTAKSF